MITITALNVLVFALWLAAKRSGRPSKMQFMFDHFTCKLSNVQQGRYHTLLTSCFSHYSFWHIGINLYVAWSFGIVLSRVFGVTSFLLLYLGSGIFSSLASLGVNAWRGGVIKGSVGASGCFFGLIGAFVLHDPSG